MIEAILPSAAVAVDTREELEVELFPEERVALGQAVEKRRREFVTARACARQALARLGLPPAPIPSGERGAPRWPPGIVGSITHCAGYRGCALAHAHALAGIGIDAEPNAPLPPGIVGEIARPEERPALTALAAAAPEVHWDRLLFCAKEAIYKVWYPIAERWLGFEDAVVTFDPLAGTFQARLLQPWPAPEPATATEPATAAALPTVLDGRWLVDDGLILTAIALAHP